MPTRNVVLTAHQAGLVEKLVASGRYQNASEVLRDGLRLIEGPIATMAGNATQSILKRRRRASRKSVSKPMVKRDCSEARNGMSSECFFSSDCAVGDVCSLHM
jgi:putative addiction module CopG family antidote